MTDLFTTEASYENIKNIAYAAVVLLFVFELIVYPKRYFKSGSILESISSFLIIFLHKYAKELFIPPLALLYVQLYQFRIMDWQWSVGSFVIALILIDFCYYLEHRSQHRFQLMWAIHAVHHQPTNINLTMANRVSVFSKLFTYWFYLPLALLGMPISMMVLAGAVNGFYQTITHGHFWQLPKPLRFVFIDCRDHHLHHVKQEDCFNKNFGAMFSVWDKVFNTHATKDLTLEIENKIKNQTVLYGLNSDLGETSVVVNPIKAQLLPFYRLLQTIKEQGLSYLWKKV